MNITATQTTLALRETFTIATGSVDTDDVSVVTLEHDGITAIGEGAPVDYWGESAASVTEAVNAEGAELLGDDLLAVERVTARLAAWDGPQGAKMALDGVLHDWVGKKVGQPVWRLLGTERVTPPTSYTIGIDTVEGTARRVSEAQGFEVLKIKVGGPGDLERLEAVRAGTSARLRVDGNQGWDLDTAAELTPRLIEMGVEFIEQPFPVGDLDAFHAYRELGQRLPILVDEGCKDLRDVAAIAGYADGIVIKLSKCGGIREAVRMVHAARALGLKVMIGCMIESELGIGQGAQLASLVDYIDLDGHLLVSSQPFTGLGLEDGRLVLSDAPGLGVVPA
jgi:L-alanine-DL-glutamate epimerase-like enolase superfamily enzyme